MLNPDTSTRLGYSKEELAAVPAGANLGLGCGNPQAIADLLTGNHFHPGNGNLDAIQTHKMGDLSNNGNTFHNNNIWGYWPGYGIRIHKPNEVSGVQVGCSNQAPQAQLGRSNVACS